MPPEIAGHHQHHHAVFSSPSPSSQRYRQHEGGVVDALDDPGHFHLDNNNNNSGSSRGPAASGLSRPQPQMLSTPGNGPTIMFRGASPTGSDRGGGEYGGGGGGRQPSPVDASPRFTSSHFFPPPRGRPDSAHRLDDYDYEPDYRDGRNRYGKRERRGDEIGPTA